MENKFEWTSELVEEYAKMYKFSSGRVTVKDFIEEKSKEVVKEKECMFSEIEINKRLDKLVAMEEGFNLGKHSQYKTFMDWQKDQDLAKKLASWAWGKEIPIEINAFENFLKRGLKEIND